MPSFPIQLKRNGTAAATPSSLLHGEVAINYADGKLFWKDASNVIQSFTFQAYALSSHTHAASAITSGTLDAARLPLATTIAAGAVIVGTGLGVSSGTVSVTYGTTSGTACQGNDSRLSDARTPTGAAGGDLTGTYPNPQIAAGAVVTADIANDAVTYAKLQNVSATDRLLGRSSVGAGDVEEITCTAFGRSLIGSADAAAARSTLSVQPTASPAFTGTVTAAAVTLSGVLLVTTGSASAPGIAFSGDPNTGIAQLSAAGLDTLSLIAGGTERFRVNGSGETISAATFVVPSGDTSIRGSGSGVGNWLGICGDAAGFGTGPAIIMRSAGAGGSTEFYSGSSQGVIINSSRQLLVTAGSGSAGSYKPGIAVSGDDDTGLQQVGGANTISLVTAGSERVRVDASGNVLVGATPSPAFSGVTPNLQAVTTSFTGSDVDGGTIAAFGSSAFAVDRGAGVVFGFKYNTAGNYVTAARVRGAKENSTDGNFAGYLAFDTRANAGNFTERMRITSAGELLIGTTTDNGAYLLQVNSQIYATNATIATSDARFKTNVESLNDATAVIEALRPVAFDFIPHAERNFATERQVGLIAQEAQSALAGTDYADSVVAQCGDHLGLAYEKLVPVLIKALQESNARISALEERLNHA